MARVNVWIPDELHSIMKAALGQVNVSQLLQGAIRDLLGCRHHELACRACAAPIDRDELVDDALSRFYRDAMWALEVLVRRAGTAEGAARVLKEVAARWRVSAATCTPLPRPTRAEREAARESMARHPSAQLAPASPILNEEGIA